MQGRDQIAVAATEEEARACVQGMAQLVHAGGEALRRRREASEESSERSKKLSFSVISLVSFRFVGLSYMLFVAGD
jgi:hypothetical protein